jgi:hypothetical protein
MDAEALHYTYRENALAAEVKYVEGRKADPCGMTNKKRSSTARIYRHT